MRLFVLEGCQCCMPENCRRSGSFNYTARVLLFLSKRYPCHFQYSMVQISHSPKSKVYALDQIGQKITFVELNNKKVFFAMNFSWHFCRILFIHRISFTVEWYSTIVHFCFKNYIRLLCWSRRRQLKSINLKF